MKPLQSIAMGLVVVILVAEFRGYDAYVDPLGWLLVLYGLRGLPSETPYRSAMWYVGGLASLVSIPLWVPTVAALVDDADPALGWAANLPKFGFAAVLCLGLVQAAARAGARKEAGWLRIALTALTVVMVLPVLVFGAGLSELGEPATLAAQVVLLVLIVLLFTYSGRPWAGAVVPESAADESGGT
ncbi:MAG: hypothetical protein WKF79_14115 [Nocardioides sp.]